MEYILRQKYFTFKDQFSISDINNNPHYRIESKFFTLPKKFWMYDNNGKEIFLVKAKMFSFTGKFLFLQNESEKGYIKNQFALFVKRCKVSTPFGMWKVKGNIFAWSFDIFDENENKIAEIDKKVLKIADSYLVKSFNDSHDDYVIAVALALDAWFHPKH